jgi:site-specific recombinase XerD
MLGHADLRSTMRYAHVLDDDVAAAFEKLSVARSPKGSPKTLQKIK